MYYRTSHNLDLVLIILHKNLTTYTLCAILYPRSSKLFLSIWFPRYTVHCTAVLICYDLLTFETLLFAPDALS